MRHGVVVRPGTEDDDTSIARLRYVVYVEELAQYPANDDGLLPEAGPAGSVAIVAEADGVLAGFVRVTPPETERYSADKHVERRAWRIGDFEAVYEIRTLTVRDEYRTTIVAAALMYAALRWAIACGARRIIAMGRRETLRLYAKAGFKRIGERVQVGQVSYELITAEANEVDAHLTDTGRRIVRAIEQRIRWRLDIPFRAAAGPCEHGGRSIDVVGSRLDRWGDRHGAVPADVLDAWFPPAPGVVAALGQDIGWLCRTAPPAAAGGLVDQIAQARGLPVESLVVGAGSSDLMYRAFLRWFTSDTRALLVQPTYGEYPHLLSEVLNARVEYLMLSPANNWQLDLGELATRLATAPDLFVLVNPANPTGQHLDRDALWTVLRDAPRRTRIWVDEAYIEYAGQDQSLERYAAGSKNVVVCKSMSKVFALSGLRVAYLVAPPTLAADLRAITPPWPVNLAGQKAAIEALNDIGYYERCWSETRLLRKQLAEDLRTRCGTQVVESVANFVLARLPADAASVVARCQSDGVYLRDVSTLAAGFDGRHIRVSVRTAADNATVVESLRSALRAPAVSAGG